MIQQILHARRLLACLLSAATEMALYFSTPFPEDNIFLRVMAIRSATGFLFSKYSYILFLDATPYIAYSILLSGIYIFALKAGRKIRQANCFFILTPGKGQNFLSWWARHTTPGIKYPRKRRAGWASRNESFFTGIAIVGAVGSGTTASCMYPFAEQILACRDEDYCGADKDDPIYYAQHTVMKAQAERQRHSNGEKAGEDQRTTTKEIALDH